MTVFAFLRHNDIDLVIVLNDTRTSLPLIFADFDCNCLRNELKCTSLFSADIEILVLHIYHHRL